MGAELATHSSNCMPDGVEEWESEDVYASQFSPRPQECSSRSTVVIFDWDDTLLCSTAVRTHQWVEDELHNLELAIKTILHTAMGLGETLIVTNGNSTWVQDSARRFLPGLLPLLSKITVVSARALYEDAYPGDPFMWKHAAFEQLLTKERQFARGVNLVALGDQFPEIDAARHVTQVIGGCSLVKTVKFREAPSVAELLGQLGRVELVLGEIVQETENQDYGMVLRHMPPFFDLTSSASGWQCVTEAQCGHGCGDPVLDVKHLLSLVA